jgi:hypothetical protein
MQPQDQKMLKKAAIDMGARAEIERDEARDNFYALLNRLNAANAVLDEFDPADPPSRFCKEVIMAKVKRIRDIIKGE